MSAKEIYIGNNKTTSSKKEITGRMVQFENESYLKISNSDGIRPFFMSVVSDSNHWMFISSNGGLSAGRKNSESALFPYYTDDKITESAEITGSKTIMHVNKKGKPIYGNRFHRDIKVFITLAEIYIKTYTVIKLFLKRLITI
jgi:hypothetical protein